PPRETLRELRLEGAVELDGDDLEDAVGQVDGQGAEPGADLEHYVLAGQLRKTADHAEDVLVDEEVLTQLALREGGHCSPKTAAAFASICRARSSRSSPRIAASADSVWTTCAGSFVVPRTGCGARYGQSVSTSRRSAGT